MNINSIFDSLKSRQIDQLETHHDEVNRILKKESGKTLAEWVTLIDIANSFHIPLDENLNYSTLSEKCITVCEEAIDQEQWKIITSYDGKGRKGQNGLSFLRDAKGRTLLMRMIKSIFLDRLITHNIATLEKDILGNNPLHYAAKKGVVDSLSKLPCNFRKKNLQGETPLHVAILHGQEKVLQYFINTKKDFNEPYKDTVLNSQMTIFIYCIMRGEISCVDLIINELINKSVKSNNLFLDQKLDKVGNFLHVAVYFKQLKMLSHLLTSSELINYLIEQKKSMKDYLEEPNSDGKTPLNLAASLGDHEAIEILFKQGALVNTKDYSQNSPLHNAAFAKKFEAVKLLTALGADIRASNGNLSPFDPLTRIKNKDVITKTIINFLTNQLNSKSEEVIDFPLQLPQNYAFKGGGPKGYAYLGVFRALEECGAVDQMKRVAGTSSGAINACLVAVGADSKYLEELMSINLLEVLLDPPEDRNALLSALENRDSAGMIKTIWQILKSAKKPVDLLLNPFNTIGSITGICKGDKFREWIDQQIYKKTGIRYCTFGELRALVNKQGSKYKHLQIFAVRLGENPQTKCFNSENRDDDNYIISDAVRASMSIPFVFEPHIMHIKQGNDRVRYEECGSFVDGGVNFNLPVEAYDQMRYLPEKGEDEVPNLFPCFNTHTIGFDLNKVSPPAQIESAKTLLDLLKGLFYSYSYGEVLRRQMNPYNESRIVEIDVGNIDLMDFDISDNKKNILIESGYNATIRYFKKQYPSTSLHQISVLRDTLEGKISLPKRITNKEFIGRKEELEELYHQGVVSNWHPTKESKIIEIVGPSGIGKTELALAFAYQNLEKFSVIKFIKSQTGNLYLQAYWELATLLAISHKNKTEEQLVNAVNSALEKQTFKEKEQAKPWLLIFDGVDKAIPLPKSGGTIIFTGLKRLNMNSSIIPLDYIQKEEFIKNLEGSPLLFSLANKYIEYSNISRKEYLEKIGQLEGPLEKRVIKLTLEYLSRNDPSSFRFLQRTAYLSPFSIDATLEDYAKENSRENLWKPLEILGIAKREDSCVLSYCPLFIEILHEANALAPFKETLKLLGDFATKLDLNLKEKLRSGFFLFEQIEHLMRKYKNLWDVQESLHEKVVCLNKAGRFLTCIHRDIEKAFYFHSEAKKIAQDFEYPEIEMEMGRSLTFLGQHDAAYEILKNTKEPQSIQAKGEYWILRGKVEQAIKNPDATTSFENALRANKGNMMHQATCLTLIADLMRKNKLHPFEQTINKYLEALKAWREACGEKVIQVVECLFNMGRVQIAHKSVDSKKTLEEALLILNEIKEAWNQSAEFPYQQTLAKVYYYLGIASWLSKNDDEALQAFKQALNIEKALTPLRARIYSNIGFLFKEQNKNFDSLQAYCEAIEIWLNQEKLKQRHQAELIAMLLQFIPVLQTRDKQEIVKIKEKYLARFKQKLGERHEVIEKLNKCGSGCTIF